MRRASQLARQRWTPVKGEHFQRIVSLQGAQLSESEGQGSMSWLRSGRAEWLHYLNIGAHDGQGLVEYALIMLLVCIACVAAVSGLGTTMVTTLWDVIQNVLIPALGG